MTLNDTPFKDCEIRSVFDKANGQWWFSAVDVCAILIGKDYDEGRKYWNRIKTQREKNQLTRKSSQLKLPSRKNGRFFLTDVVDITTLAYLIQTTPGQASEPFKLWLAETIVASTNIEEALASAGEGFAKDIASFREKGPYGISSLVKESMV